MDELRKFNLTRIRGAPYEDHYDCVWKIILSIKILHGTYLMHTTFIQASAPYNWFHQAPWFDLFTLLVPFQLENCNNQVWENFDPSSTVSEVEELWFQSLVHWFLFKTIVPAIDFAFVTVSRVAENNLYILARSFEQNEKKYFGITSAQISDRKPNIDLLRYAFWPKMTIGSGMPRYKGKTGIFVSQNRLDSKMRI